MKNLMRPPLLLLAAAAATGISADALLRAMPAGVNWTICLLLPAGFLIVLARRLDRPLEGGWTAVAVLSILCAAGLSWRASPALGLFNAAAALAGSALIGMRLSGHGLRRSSMFELAHGIIVHAVHAIAGAGFLIAREFFPASRAETSRKSPLPSLLRGGAIALPVILLFGALFASADARFEELAGRLFDFDLATVFSHVALTCTVAWISAGFLRGSLLANEVPAPSAPGESFLTVGIIEAGMLVGLLDALFLLFVVLQIPYLFGGAGTIEATPSLTVASYFRRGFFELTAVACFAIVTLLLADWMVRKDTRRHVMIFRSLAALNAALLGVIMASAWQRFFLYQESYGLTRPRIFAAAALTGFGLVTVWFACSVLTGRRNRFAFGSIIAAYIVALSLDIVNPDALIARVNIARGSEGKPFDSAYMATLSPDAAPELIDGLSRLPPADAAPVARALIRRSDNGPTDWRTWNWSRAKAAREEENRHDILSDMAKSDHHIP